MSEYEIDPVAVQRMIEACEQAAQAFREVGRTFTEIGAMISRPPKPIPKQLDGDSTSFYSRGDGP